MLGGGVVAVSSRKCPFSPHKTSSNETREFGIRIFRFMTTNRLSLSCLLASSLDNKNIFPQGGGEDAQCKSYS